MTAHAKTCPATGELVHGVQPDFRPGVPLSVVTKKKKKHPKNDGRRDRRGGRPDVAPGDSSRPSMQHDVGQREQVVLDGPLVFDLDRVLTGGLPFAFETDQTMRLGILPRASEADGDSDSDVIWVDTGEPCFAYHVVNCYDDPEDADVVVVDVCKSDGTNALGMARGFDDDADGQGWRPANGCGETREELEALDAVKTVSKNGYVGDDAMGVRGAENAFAAFVNAPRGSVPSSPSSIKLVVRSKSRARKKKKNQKRVVRGAERRRAPALGRRKRRRARTGRRGVVAMARVFTNENLGVFTAAVRGAVRLPVRRPAGRRRSARLLLHRRIRDGDFAEAAHGRALLRQGAQARRRRRHAPHVLPGPGPRVRRHRVRPENHRGRKGGAPAGADARRRRGRRVRERRDEPRDKLGSRKFTKKKKNARRETRSD